jgi:hypothetical protein
VRPVGQGLSTAGARHPYARLDALPPWAPPRIPRPRPIMGTPRPRGTAAGGAMAMP